MEINQENYTKLKTSGLKRAEMAATFGVPDWKLKKIISDNGWGKKPCVIANENAFDEYTELSAYWAGFLAADGCVDTKNRVRLMLKYDDIGHVEKLKEFLGCTHTISVNTDQYNRCSLEVTSLHICEVLDINYNIIPNKTDKLKFPKHLPTEPLRHYLRGYFDGDGSLCEGFSNINSVTSSIYATFCSGCKEYAEELFEYLQKELRLGGHLQSFKDSNKYQLKFNTNDAKTLTKYLYSDSNIFLDRKYNLYQKLIVNDIRKNEIMV